jgi:hypothetical protein
MEGPTITIGGIPAQVTSISPGASGEPWGIPDFDHVILRERWRGYHILDIKPPFPFHVYIIYPRKGWQALTENMHADDIFVMARGELFRTFDDAVSKKHDPDPSPAPWQRTWRQKLKDWWNGVDPYLNRPGQFGEGKDRSSSWRIY